MTTNERLQYSSGCLLGISMRRNNLLEPEEVEALQKASELLREQADLNDELVGALQAVLNSEDSTLGDGGSVLGDDLREHAKAVLAKAKEP